MSGIQALVLMAVLSVAPAALLVGLLSGLRRWQRTPMMAVYADRSGVEIHEVSIEDAVRGAFGLQADYTERPSSDEFRF